MVKKNKLGCVYMSDESAGTPACYLPNDARKSEEEDAPLCFFAEYPCGDMTLLFLEHCGTIHFTLVPASMRNAVVPHRQKVMDSPTARVVGKIYGKRSAWHSESMMDFKVAGDADAGAFVPGSSMRSGETVTNLLEYTGQRREGDLLITTFRHKMRPLLLQNVIRIKTGEPWIEVWNEITNTGSGPEKLESFQSFSLGLLSPFQRGNGTGCYFLHRARSNWAAEGRPECRSVEEAGLEVSWQSFGIRTERFGQRSSMPVKDYFPFAAFEDRAAGVTWGAQLAASGPWQMEFSRLGDFLNLSGGITDFEFNGWTKTLAPGETFRGIPAVLSCVKGDVQDVCNRLTRYQLETPQPGSEETLPVLFNEYCSTWGNPSKAKLDPLADRLQDKGIGYFMMDAGWYAVKPGQWSGTIGEWLPNLEMYEGDFKGFVASLRQRGFVPGIWFEFDVIENPKAGSEVEKLLLRRDGKIILHPPRAFLDHRKAAVRERLDKKVLKFLKENNLGYTKVDYNGCYSPTIDGPDSGPENLRQATDADLAYFAHLKQELPELVIEICASGGHRLSPAWLRIGAMASFSDAHEGLEIPLIAANVQRMIPLSKSQIWAVVHETDSEQRLCYSLAAAMIGRLCLSGDYDKLSAAQQRIVDDAIQFYPKIAPFVKNGESRFERSVTGSFNFPVGWQIFRRTNAQGGYFVIHTFANAPTRIELPLHGLKLAERLAPSQLQVSVKEDTLVIEKMGDFCGAVLLLQK